MTATLFGVALNFLPLALLFQLFDFALDQVALQNAQMLDEEDAVEMIDLVAEGAREKVFPANLEAIAFGVLRFYGDELRANDIAAKAGNGEAAFFFALFAFGVDDFRIG